MDASLEAQLQDLMRVFLAENTKLNLSALRTEDACWYGNILDSLPFLELIEKHIIPLPHSILDVGTGGGFPLLPLAMALPQTRCVGLDSTAKKMDAVKRVAVDLNLSNVDVLAGRAEIFAHSSDHRERYDAVIARAVAPLSTLLEFTIPFAAPTGVVVLWKSMHIDDEQVQSAAAQKELHCRLTDAHTYDLGGNWGTRQLLVFRKDGPTPNLYPRETGVPKKMPLM